MKTKEEILKMTKQEMLAYKWSADLNTKSSRCSCCYDCFRCSLCYDCSNCSRCYDCSDCSLCYDCSNCSRCYDCSNCFRCSDCSRCSDCFGCRNLYEEAEYQYMICNVQFTREEYEAKVNDLTKKGAEE